MLADLRLAFRQLRQSPGFAVVALLTLALGIGACTAIFSVVNSVLLRPLPYFESDRIMVVKETKLPQFPEYSVAAADYFDWLEQAKSFESLAMAGLGFGNLTGAGDPTVVTVKRLTANYLGTLRVRPLLGRDFTPEEAATKARVALLSEGLWLRQFGGRPGIVNETIQLNGGAVTVIGVLPATADPGNFPGTSPGQVADIVVPAAFTDVRHDRLSRNYAVIGRLKPGVTPAEARSELLLIAARLEKQYPATNAGWGVKVTPLLESTVGAASPILYSLFGAVGFMLLIACANVANLMLARATARTREISLRIALGASRSRIVRQLLSESVLLSVLGGALGILVAWWGMRAFVAFAPVTLPRTQEITLDLRALGFSFMLAVLTGVAFGLVPAFQASRVDLNRALQDGGRGTGATGRRQGARGALVIAEVALALILLVGAGLLIRSFRRLQGTYPGFQQHNALAVTLSLSGKRFGTGPQKAAFIAQVGGKLAALHGVQSVGAADVMPFSGMEYTPYFDIAGQPASETRKQTIAYTVTSDYFKAMGIPLLRGRFFDQRDTAAAPLVAIINESMAKRFFPGVDPIGQRISVYGSPTSSLIFREIVGIVGDVKNSQLNESAKVQTYLAVAQRPLDYFTFVVRTAGPVPDLPAAVRNVIASVDKAQPIARLQPLSELVGASTAGERFVMFLFAVFSSLALLLALIGIYGVMAYAVTQRTSEIGIRMALGAQRGSVLRLIFLQGGRLVALGLVCGGIGALLLTRLIASMLVGVGAQDPVTFVGIALLLAGAAAVACLVPAWRATKVDPLVALRAE